MELKRNRFIDQCLNDTNPTLAVEWFQVFNHSHDNVHDKTPGAKSVFPPSGCAGFGNFSNLEWNVSISI